MKILIIFLVLCAIAVMLGLFTISARLLKQTQRQINKENQKNYK